MEKNQNFEIIIGDNSELNISEVNSYANKLRPQDLDKRKKKVIIPIEKNKKNGVNK